jgi:hypothetical protein
VQPQPALQQTNPFEGLGKKKQTPVITDVINNPIIGGRVTICVLLYGNYAHLHRQCLSAIVSTTSTEHRQLRVACNEVCPETLQYLSELHDKQQVYKVIVNQTNEKKYPAMRQLLHDPKHPIEDKWIIWLDDDSIANRDPAWLAKLLHKIVASHPDGARLFGAEFYWKFNQSQVAWIRSRPWYRNRAFQTRNGREAPNGDHVKFAAGGFWALDMDVVRRANIPDPDIGQNGGDYMIGEQVWQAGFSLAGWNNKKQFIFTSSVKRRGLEEVHTGDSGWQPGGVFKKMHS